MWKIKILEEEIIGVLGFGHSPSTLPYAQTNQY